MLLQILILLLLVGLNGLFALAELAVIGARKTRLQALAAQGDKGAEAALRLRGNSARFLSTVSIGITLIGVMVSTIGGDSFVGPLGDRLALIPGLADYAHSLALGLVVVTIAAVSLIIGELVPKRVAVAHPERLATRVARFMTVFAQIATPIEWLLSGITSLILHLIGLGVASETPVTDDEINLLMREGAAVGSFQPVESSLVRMALRLGDRHVDALMTPRTQVELIDLEDGWEVNRAKIRSANFSRFPVVEGGPESVLGILETKSLLARALAGEAIDLRQAVRPPVYVPNTMPALKLLETLKQTGEPMVLVVDEYGDFDGLVTLHDIMQALVGDIAEPGEPEERSAIRHEDGSWLIDGMMPIDEVKDTVGLARVPEEESGDFHTLGGLIMSVMKRVPRVADQLDIAGWRFEVVAMDGHRVDKVLVSPHPPR